MYPEQNMIVRFENPDDPAERSAIWSVNEAAFGRPDEADLVDTLRANGVVLASLVAESEHRIVGHILFSRIWIETVPAAALAPVAVLPEYQRQGIGGTLITRGIDSMRTRGERITLVLGHPEYYEHFGFSAETAGNLEIPFPPEAFMAMELSPGALANIRGKVKYPAAFQLSAEHTINAETIQRISSRV
jgi:putative acetyltransferase